MLKNFAMQFEFWEPMETAKQWKHMESMTGSLDLEDGGYLERCWISQLLERKVEFLNFLVNNPEHREEIMQGMPPLIQYFATEVQHSGEGQSAGERFEDAAAAGEVLKKSN